MRQNLRRQVQHQLSTGIDLTRWVGSIGLAVAVGIAYFVAARLSLALLTKPEGVAVFWPAAGVSAGALIALGSRARWPVVVGTLAATIVANLSGDRNLWSAVLFALCNAGEAVLTAWLIGHYFGSDFRLNKLRNVLWFVAAAIMGTAVSGIGGAIVFKLFHSRTTPILKTWKHWFASDGLGIITVAPLLIELASASRDRPPLSEFVEGALAVAALALVSGLAIFSCGRSFWLPLGRSPCCSRRCCGLRLVAGRFSPRQPRSSLAFQSFGRPPLALAISVIRVFQWPSASGRPKSAFYL